MTAEELAEIRKRHESECADELDIPIRAYAGPTLRHTNAHDDRAALLAYTDAQAQRIAELEREAEKLRECCAINQQDWADAELQIERLKAQLAARGPNRYRMLQAAMGECEMSTVGDDVPERVCMNDNCMCERIVDALLSSGALATAPAEKLQENSCPPRRCDSVGIGGEMGSLSPVATAQAVTLTEEERAFIAEHHWRIYLMPGEQAKLWAIIDRLTNGASAP